MKKKLPELKSDKEAEEFVAGSDLTDYDLAALRPWGSSARNRLWKNSGRATMVDRK